MWTDLFKTRMDKDISKRAYYMKFIFNSHFLIFLTIALGAFFYSLFGLRETLVGNIYVDMLVAVLIAFSITPTYRSLLKEADSIFLTPVEEELSGYFKQAERYSLILSYTFPVVMMFLTFMLVLINHSPEEMAVFFIGVLVAVYMTFKIKVASIHTLVNTQLLMYCLVVLNAVLFFLSLIKIYFVILIPVVLLIILTILNKKRVLRVNWTGLIEYETHEINRFNTIISMFTNVKSSEKKFKRRQYLDFLMKKHNVKHFNEKYMYDYMFHRSFLRDHDLPMIILRLILLFGIFIIWMSNIYVTIIFSLFVLYIIILQLTQIYSAQAYLLWPKIWPVSRKNIQVSYIRYSHKLVFILSLIFALLFIALHTEVFYASIIFPIFGYILNTVFSKNVYKKENALSD